MAITNGSFEDSFFTDPIPGWDKTLSGGTATVLNSWTGYTYIYDPQDDGENILRLSTSTGGVGVNQKVEQTVAMTTGQELQGWAGFDNRDAGRDYARVEILQSGSVVATPFSANGVDVDWTFWTWTCPADDDYVVRLLVVNEVAASGTSHGLFDAIEIIDYVPTGVSITPAQINFTTTFQAPLVYTSGQHITPEQLALTQSFQAPALKIGNKITVSELALGLVFQAPDIVNRTLTPIANLWMKTQYRCTLTGAPDSTTDLILPISSFQTRHDNDPRRTYLSVVVPGIDNYIDAINARPNGRLKIDRIYTYLAGDTDTFEMANTIYDSITISQGGRAGSTGQITGFENLPYLSAETITLSSPVYRASENGRRRYRCAIDPRVRPGDTVTINSETFVTSSVLYIIDSKTAIMEVQELL